MASPVEGLKSLRVDKLLITHQQFNLSTFKQKQAKLAFTMAEILLSLTIIGVVAAITLPSLTGNINERTWNTQRKALYSRMSQAISLMPALNGYGSTDDNAAETFITNGLAKVLKINNICDSESLSECGIPQKMIGQQGTVAFDSFPKTLRAWNGLFTPGNMSGVSINTKVAAFETANGESIALFYNPRCISDYAIRLRVDWEQYTQPFMCANFIYDLNGKKGPNTLGKDVGVITAMYATDSRVVAPLPVVDKLKTDGEAAKYTHAEAVSICKTVYEDSRLPNIDELIAMWYNRSFFALTHADETTNYWSSTRIENYAWRLMGGTGRKGPDSLLREKQVRCVKRM